MAHGIVLHGTRARRKHFATKYRPWKRKLPGLRKLDWSRANGKLWEERAMIAGRVSKTDNNVTLTTNAIKRSLGLELSPEEAHIEQAFQRGNHASNSRQAT